MGIVLILAAVLGLVAGNALNARDGGAISPGTGAAAVPHLSGFDGARYDALDGTAIDAPAYADAEAFTQTWGNLDERGESRPSNGTSVRESMTAPTPR